MLPARGNAAQQPYNTLLSDQLERDGWIVDEAYKRWIYRPWSARIFHVHWPEYLFRGRFAVLRTIVTIYALIVHRMFHGEVIQTIHNVRPHEGILTLREGLGLSIVDRLTTGVLVHSETAAQSLRTKRPSLRPKRIEVVGLPLYPVLATNSTRGDTRQALAIGDDVCLFLHFGQQRRYKGTLDLLSVWIHDPPTGSHLLLAGLPDELTEKEINRLVDPSRHVSADLRLLPAIELHKLIIASDIVVLPYEHIDTSGSVALALSLGRPVLVPDMPLMRDLGLRVGKEWVVTYAGKFSSAALLSGRQDPRRQLGSIRSSLFPTYQDLARTCAALYG